MQLGGTPAQLYDQVKDGVIDLTWVPPGYTPGRFPKSETFELPFIAGNGEKNSPAGWEFYEKHLKDEFKDVKMLAIKTHGPGLIHAKGNGVRKLEDMKGLKIRGPSRIVNKMIETLGATPVGMPVTAMADALSKGVIDGTVVPWEVTTPLQYRRTRQHAHDSSAATAASASRFSSSSMNKAKYDSLPAGPEEGDRRQFRPRDVEMGRQGAERRRRAGPRSRQAARQRHRHARRRRDGALAQGAPSP